MIGSGTADSTTADHTFKLSFQPITDLATCAYAISCDPISYTVLGPIENIEIILDAHSQASRQGIYTRYFDEFIPLFGQGMSAFASAECTSHMSYDISYTGTPPSSDYNWLVLDS